MDTMDFSTQRRIQIEECLLERMRSLPFHQITVADLCKRLGIARKTFYYYYPSKEDCLYDVIDWKIQESALYCATAPASAPQKLQIYRANLIYWKNQKPFLDALTKCGFSWMFLDRCSRYFLEEEKRIQGMMDAPGVKFDTDVLNFYMSGQIAMMIQWYLRDFDTPVEEMAQKYVRLIHTPLLPQL